MSQETLNDYKNNKSPLWIKTKTWMNPWSIGPVEYEWNGEGLLTIKDSQEDNDEYKKGRLIYETVHEWREMVWSILEQNSKMQSEPLWVRKWEKKYNQVWEELMEFKQEPGIVYEIMNVILMGWESGADEDCKWLKQWQEKIDEDLRLDERAVMGVNVLESILLGGISNKEVWKWALAREERKKVEGWRWKSPTESMDFSQRVGDLWRSLSQEIGAKDEEGVLIGRGVWEMEKPNDEVLQEKIEKIKAGEKNAKSNDQKIIDQEVEKQEQLKKDWIEKWRKGSKIKGWDGSEVVLRDSPIHRVEMNIGVSEKDEHMIRVWREVCYSMKAEEVVEREKRGLSAGWLADALWDEEPLRVLRWIEELKDERDDGGEKLRNRILEIESFIKQEKMDDWSIQRSPLITQYWVKRALQGDESAMKFVKEKNINMQYWGVKKSITKTLNASQNVTATMMVELIENITKYGAYFETEEEKETWLSSKIDAMKNSRYGVDWIVDRITEREYLSGDKAVLWKDLRTQIYDDITDRDVGWKGWVNEVKLEKQPWAETIESLEKGKREIEGGVSGWSYESELWKKDKLIKNRIKEWKERWLDLENWRSTLIEEGSWDDKDEDSWRRSKEYWDERILKLALELPVQESSKKVYCNEGIKEWAEAVLERKNKDSPKMEIKKSKRL